MKKIKIAPIFHKYTLAKGEVLLKDMSEIEQPYFMNIICKDTKLDEIQQFGDVSYN